MANKLTYSTKKKFCLELLNERVKKVWPSFNGSLLTWLKDIFKLSNLKLYLLPHLCCWGRPLVCLPSWRHHIPWSILEDPLHSEQLRMCCLQSIWSYWTQSFSTVGQQLDCSTEDPTVWRPPRISTAARETDQQLLCLYEEPPVRRPHRKSAIAKATGLPGDLKQPRDQRGRLQTFTQTNKHQAIFFFFFCGNSRCRKAI